MGKIPRIALLVAFGLMALFFVGNSVYILSNYYFQWHTDEGPTGLFITLLITGLNMVFGAYGAILFNTLYKRHKSFIYFYMIGLIAFVIFVYIISLPGPMFKDIKDFLLFIVIIAPIAAIGVYYAVHPEKIGIISGV